MSNPDQGGQENQGGQQDQKPGQQQQNPGQGGQQGDQKPGQQEQQKKLRAALNVAARDKLGRSSAPRYNTLP